MSMEVREMGIKVKCYICGKEGEYPRNQTKKKIPSVASEELCGFRRVKDENGNTVYVCIACSEGGLG